MATVAPECRAGDRSRYPVDSQPVLALEDTDGRDRAGADDPVDRSRVEAATHERHQRGYPEHADAGGTSPPPSRCPSAHLSVESDCSIDAWRRDFSSADRSLTVK